MTYYACIEYKDGYIVKLPFNTREEAREYIEEHFNKEKHSKCWTE